ncbi:MAG: TolB family protein, partial [Steroidobacteraceae bacterium]
MAEVVTPPHNRAPELEDFLKLQEFGSVRPSPDGRLLAVEIARPRAGERWTGIEHEAARSDLWIVEVSSGRATQITNGTEDGSWYWSSVWAPNSQRLVLLTRQADGAVRLALWERGSRGVRLLSNA